MKTKKLIKEPFKITFLKKVNQKEGVFNPLKVFHPKEFTNAEMISLRSNISSYDSERENNLIKISAGILIMFGLITCGVSASEQGLVAHWSFDDGTATDEAGNNPFETLVSKDFLV